MARPPPGPDLDCAIKLLKGEFSSDPGLVARFEREAKAAAQLKSPYVVQIYDFGLADGVPFIAMEYLEGEDLAQRIARKGPLSAAETLAILGQVSRALTKAHAAGIVHRDLKPENIFLVADDKDETAKVVDFGVAKDYSSSLSLTREGMMLGTPTYMSPEQINGVANIDRRANLGRSPSLPSSA